MTTVVFSTPREYRPLVFGFFFFSSRRRHTRYIGDWSSDVCSSDLARPGARGPARTPRRSGAVHHWPWLEDGRGGAPSAPRGPGDRAAAAGRNDSRGGGTDMAITLNLPSVLAAHPGGARTIQATRRTPGEAVAGVAARYPALAPRLRDKDGKPYPFVNFYLNDEDVRFRGGFAAPVQDGDEVTVIPAIAGG